VEISPGESSNLQPACGRGRTFFLHELPQVLRADTVAEITEPFAGVPAAREVGEEWLEGVGDIRQRDLVEQAVAQPRPLKSPPA
jgi:hypothetical protein